MATNRPEDHRRKWDTSEYEKAEKRRLEEGEDSDEDDKSAKAPVKRELLKARDYKVDLDSKLGKSVVITNATPANQAGGYFCNVCDCLVKDSINFLDHINGKKHQRNLGMSMKLERSTLDQVKNRFVLNKQKKEDQKKAYNYEERMKELKEEGAKASEKRKEAKKAKKNKSGPTSEEAADAQDGNADDMAAIMGFSSFRSSN